ncbi:MAG: hypothetical protein ACJ8F0_05575 [Xanthobacteraceae bacterium]|jgi:hypothetical protein
MPPDLIFWIGVAIKMAITALFVSVATIIAEKLGPAVGALVATLPVSAGPVYVFLALDHDAAFVSASALASLALNAATAIHVTVYVLLAQRHGIWISVTLALAVWFAAALVFGPIHWTAWAALVLNLVIFVLCFFIVERYGHVCMPPTKRTRYDLLIRAGMVALLVGAVLTLSFRIGPAGSGILAVFPVIYTSIMVILHCRVGGPATAAVLAHAIPGLAGFGMALLTLHLTAVPLGSTGALIIAFSVSVAWNVMVYVLQRQQVHT